MAESQAVPCSLSLIPYLLSLILPLLGTGSPFPLFLKKKGQGEVSLPLFGVPWML